MLLLGLIFVVLVIFAPNGLAGLLARLRRRARPEPSSAQPPDTAGTQPIPPKPGIPASREL